MLNDLLDPSTAIRVSGHETFPLRLLWLKKAYDLVSAPEGADRRTFHEQEAIARLGVGKNMALSMRHWAIAADVIGDGERKLSATEFGRRLFDEGGYDPYLEQHSTLWLIHMQLVATPTFATTFHYAFNRMHHISFSREDLAQAMSAIVTARGARATTETLKRDVEVFVRSYAPRLTESGEDASEPLLVELGLLREMKQGGQLEFVRGPKKSLADGVFALCLKRFWKLHHPQAPTLSVEQIQYGVGSPGRIFKLDEDSLVVRLMRIADATQGRLAWTDTAGLRQVALVGDLDGIDEAELVASSYTAGSR